jgi:hypothetical protein
MIIYNVLQFCNDDNNRGINIPMKREIVRVAKAAGKK